MLGKVWKDGFSWAENCPHEYRVVLLYHQAVNEIGKNSTARDNVYAFSYTSLMDIMKDFSSISVTRVVIGYILMVRFVLRLCN